MIEPTGGPRHERDIVPWHKHELHFGDTGFDGTVKIGPDTMGNVGLDNERIRIEVIVDRFTPEKRSEIMSRVRCKNTTPEWIVRRMVHWLGYRYRLHVKKLPGSPDLVFWRRRRVIFVHGCFFHQHSCAAGTIPKTHTTFWKSKLGKNVERDKTTVALLKRSGWKIFTLWECELGDAVRLERRLRKFLSGE